MNFWKTIKELFDGSYYHGMNCPPKNALPPPPYPKKKSGVSEKDYREVLTDALETLVEVKEIIKIEGYLGKQISGDISKIERILKKD